MKPIYLDYNATTPCHPLVVEAMMPYFSEIYGNPGNGYHSLGRAGARAVDRAREQLAAAINASPTEIFFTSGATESNNLAILGLAQRALGNRRRIVTSSIEHKAVLLPVEQLHQKLGFEVVTLPVDDNGIVSVEAAAEIINEQTLLVSLHGANNEIGTLQPIPELAQLARSAGAFVHCDAAQMMGKVPVDVAELEVDMLSLSGHKFYGPKGIGALYVRGGQSNVPLEPLMYGGGQEKNLRPGTTNVPAIVGIGRAAELCLVNLAREGERMQGLRDRLETALAHSIKGLLINGRSAPRLPNTSSLTFPQIDADALLLNLPQLMMGTGSACTSGAVEPSHVLTAIGLTRSQASSTIRLSIGHPTTSEEIETTQIMIYDAFMHLKAMSS